MLENPDDRVSVWDTNNEAAVDGSSIFDRLCLVEVSWCHVGCYMGCRKGCLDTNKKINYRFRQ
jgi:hypothetical protein